MKGLVTIFTCIAGLTSFGQDPVNVPHDESKTVEFEQDSVNQNIYKAFISDENDYYVPFDILDSLKGTGDFELLVFTGTDDLVFQFTGDFEKGEYTKYYPSGELYGLGKIRGGAHYGYYKEYDKMGDLILKCFYEENRIRTKGKGFLRKRGDEILCDKKWFQKVDYDSCVFFSGAPGFFLLAF